MADCDDVLLTTKLAKVRTSRSDSSWPWITVIAPGGKLRVMVIDQRRSAFRSSSHASRLANIRPKAQTLKRIANRSSMVEAFHELRRSNSQRYCVNTHARER